MGTPNAAPRHRGKDKKQRRLPGQPATGPVACNLRQYRLAKGWSGARLAREAGTTQSMISTLEAGRTNPSMPLGRRIARLVGQPVEVVWPETAGAKS